MKHFILTAAAAAALIALGSCSKIETVGVSDANYIGFEGAFVGNPTKAVEEITEGTINNFYVYGAYQNTEDVFTNVEVKKDVNGWTYVDQKEWVANQTYRFAAYYSDQPLVNGESVEFSYDNGNLTITGFESSPKHQVDLLYDEYEYVSKAEGTTNEKVKFNFRHLLSIVKFTFNSGFNEDVQVTVSDMKFYGMFPQGTVTPTTTQTEWATVGTKLVEGTGFNLFQAEDANNTATVAEGKSTPAYDNCIVIPQEFTDNAMIAVFKVTVAGTGIPGGSDEKTITAYLPADKWEPGYRYNYVATISGQTMNYIEFDAPEVTEWKNEPDVNMVNDERADNDGHIVIDPNN